MTFTVVLPWPSGELSPNARCHWRDLARVKKAYRHACGVLALAAGAKSYGESTPVGAKLAVHLDFYPPNKRSRDADNCIASMKSGMDGLADALAIDDKHFRTSYELHEQIGGFVRVTVKVKDPACQS